MTVAIGLLSPTAIVSEEMSASRDMSKLKKPTFELPLLSRRTQVALPKSSADLFVKIAICQSKKFGGNSLHQARALILNVP